MESRKLVLVLAWLQLLLASLAVSRKVYIHNISPSYVWRDKRQSHPQSTFARIPEVPFGDSSPSGSSFPGPPELVEYLTPPPLPVDSLTAAASVSNNKIPQGPWELGYDANDILVPPSDQVRQYDTITSFSLVPGPEREDSFPSLVDSDSDTSGSVGSVEDLGSLQDFKRDQRAPKPSKGPVYTYVKTDKHGHFKWGVRHGN